MHPSIHPSMHSLMHSHCHSIVHLLTRAAVINAYILLCTRPQADDPILKELPVSHGGLPTVIVCFLCAMSVPPAVTVSQALPSSDLVAITCHVQRFYPQHVHLTWMENCEMFTGAEKPTSKQNSDGTYSLESLQLVNASVQGSERVFTCIVQHDAQPPTSANLILSPAVHTTYKPTESPGKLTSSLMSCWVTSVSWVDSERQWGSVCVIVKGLPDLRACDSLNTQNGFWPVASFRCGHLERFFHF